MIYICAFMVLIMYAYSRLQESMISTQKETINSLSDALSEANQNFEMEKMKTKCQAVIINEQKKIIDRLCAAVDEYVDKVEGEQVQQWAKKIQEDGIS